MDEEKEKSLTDKQRRFCEEYVVDWNGTRAAIAAGYSENTASVIACENLKKPLIVSYIKSIKKEAIFKINEIEQKKDMLNVGFVYLIHCEGTEFYKIGKTKRNIKYRLGQLQSMSPFKLSVVNVIRVEDSSAIEKDAQSFFSNKKVRGEWFKFTSKELSGVISKMKSYE